MGDEDLREELAGLKEENEHLKAGKAGPSASRRLPKRSRW
jgi:hypothetical protein